MKKLIPAVLGVAILAAGCILPNKYQTTITVEKDACQVDYKGHFVVLVAANPEMPAEQKTKLTIDTMKRLEADILKEKGTITTKMTEPGVFEAAISYKQAIGQNPARVLNLFSIQGDGQGKVTVQSFELNAGDRQNFSAQGINGVGELTVKTAGQVLEENAQDKPGWLAKWIGGGYTWKQDLLKSPQASMVIQF